MANPDGSPVTSVWQDVVAYRRAYLLTAVASFGGMLFGWDTGLIGGVLTMSSFKTSFGLDVDPHAYANLSGNIVSVLQAGCFFGAMASFYVSDTFGRKKALIFADIIFLVGSTIQATCAINTHSLAQLYVGRVIGGFGVGLVSAVVPTYIGENANKEIRGRCIGCMQLFNVTGIMLSFFVNYGMTQHTPDTSAAQWRIPFALQMVPGAILLLGLIFQNESPRWLVEKNRLEEARRALACVRAKGHDDPAVTSELEDIIQDFNGHEKMSLYAQLKATCSDRKTFYTFTMAITLMFWQQATGTNAINYYAPQILKAVGLNGQSAGLFATGIYGVVKVCITALGLMFATEQVGRKWSLIIGASGQAFAMYYMGINQAVNPVHPGDALNGNSIFAIICVYLFVVFYSFGWGPIPFVLSAECSPNHVRSLIMAAALMTQWLFNFVIAKITPIMLADITFGTFIVFGTCCLLMVVYTVFCVPETKGVPLESMHILFEGNIIAGALKDTIPRHSRAKALKHNTDVREEEADDVEFAKGDFVTTHVEDVSGKGMASSSSAAGRV
ncbi:general substrate transporter [Polychaeton citri CBS 116435]|uniref:General substrate transporter n=1 Tax=Polychaeton citri CBS 116435 TaxID=1314669 RepID=A0A9P4QDK3_9PEZI|nr:general substrate transporter [Polychaeton citri CBS 116435]